MVRPPSSGSSLRMSASADSVSSPSSVSATITSASPWTGRPPTNCHDGKYERPEISMDISWPLATRADTACRLIPPSRSATSDVVYERARSSRSAVTSR